MTGEAGLVDPAGKDFRLLPGSAAIDRGAVLDPPVTVDHDGLPRPVGPAPDIGAHEFQGSAPSPTATPTPTMVATATPTLTPQVTPTLEDAIVRALLGDKTARAQDLNGDGVIDIADLFVVRQN